MDGDDAARVEAMTPRGGGAAAVRALRKAERFRGRPAPGAKASRRAGLGGCGSSASASPSPSVGTAATDGDAAADGERRFGPSAVRRQRVLSSVRRENI